MNNISKNQVSKIIISVIMMTYIIQGAYIERVTDTDVNEYLYHRDGTTLVEVGNPLQTPMCGSNDIIDPPTTNASNEYLDSGESINYTGSVATNVGQDALYEYYTGAGAFGTQLNAPADRYAYVRYFSASTIESSAYYGEIGPWEVPPVPNTSAIGASYQIDKVNPAYAIEFSVVPNNTADAAQISGTIINVGSGNNELSGDFLEIFYTGPITGAYETVASDGTFTFAPGTAGDYTVQARVKAANSPSPGFPISTGYSITNVVPEPGLFIIYCLSFFIYNRFRNRKGTIINC